MSLVRRDARAQAEAGAQVLDVNVGFAGADEPAVMEQVVRAIMEEVDLPLCIDSPQPRAVAVGLRTFQAMGGRKALINSTTAESEKLASILPLAAQYGAAVIGLAHDERGINYDINARLDAAAKIIGQAVRHGIPTADVLIDALTLAAGADPSAGITALETQRRVWQDLEVNSTTGASNISFGLPNRLALNTAYLALMMSRGLTTAIANPLETGVQEIVRAGNVLMGRDPDARRWIRAFRQTQVVAGPPAA